MAKQDDIVDAAVAILAEHGSDGLTAARLAATARVSKGNLFHHFPTLDDVVLAAFERFVLGMHSVSDPPATSLREWLLSLGADAAHSVDEAPAVTGAYLAFVSRARADDRLRGRLADVAEQAEHAFAATIARLAPDLPDPAALATMLLVAGDGLAVHRQMFPERAAEQWAGWRRLVDAIAPETLGTADHAPKGDAR